MRRAYFAAAVCGAVLTVGCPEAGPPKRETAKPVDDGRDPTPSQVKAAGAKPEKSEPAAEAAIEKLLAAHTGGKPERLEAVKVYKLVRKGEFKVEGGPGPTVWTTAASWPDRYKTVAEFSRHGNKKSIKSRIGSVGWELNELAGMTEARPMDALTSDVFRKDVSVEWWSLLVPLLEKTARTAASIDPVAIDGKPTTGVCVWYRDQSPIILRIDNGSGLLTRIEYTNVVSSGLSPFSIRFTSHATAGGVTLPAKSQYVVNQELISTWDTAEYEFPKQIPDETFLKP